MTGKFFMPADRVTVDCKLVARVVRQDEPSCRLGERALLIEQLTCSQGRV
jgi:hypothetical protein